MLRALILATLLAAGSRALAQERVQHALGEFTLTVSGNGILVAAPHGTYDTNTPQIALEAAKLLGAGSLVALRFRVDKVRINVNRPTEGAQLPCAQEAHTDRAKEVYGIYAGLVRKAAAGSPLRLYVDVHGNAHPPSARHIEVASTGLSAAQARMVKNAYPAMLVSVREQIPGYPELVLLMEPADRIHFGAGCAKKLGIYADPLVPRAIHFEFPRSARDGANQQGSARIIAEIVRLLIESR